MANLFRIIVIYISLVHIPLLNPNLAFYSSAKLIHEDDAHYIKISTGCSDDNDCQPKCEAKGYGDISHCTTLQEILETIELIGAKPVLVDSITTEIEGSIPIGGTEGSGLDDSEIDKDGTSCFCVKLMPTADDAAPSE